MEWINKVICSDALETLKQMPSEYVDCCVTSPPYWGLRDYGTDKQLGLEKTFEEYITKLCDIFDEVKRVLKQTGTCWVVLGDTYASMGGASRHFGYQDPKYEKGRAGNYIEPSAFPQTVEPKSLCLIPFRFAIEMCSRGWICRNVIIWYKPNCMPSSAKDRFTVDFEYVFFFVKNKKYWFEQQFEEHQRDWAGCGGNIAGNGLHKKGNGYEIVNRQEVIPNPLGRNRRCVWQIPTQPFPEAHFAVYPEKLIETPIRAGCPPNGIVIDPFAGSGTTGVEARKQGKDFILIDVKEEYCKMARKRLMAVPESLFKNV